MLKVLLIEDNPADALMCRNVLCDLGIALDVKETSSLKAAIDLAGEADLVLLDLSLRDSEPARTIARMVDFRALTVVLTGNLDPALMYWAGRCGAVGWVSKGNMLWQFVPTVLRALGEAQREGRLREDLAAELQNTFPLRTAE